MKKILLAALVIFLLGVAGYFAYGFFSAPQDAPETVRTPRPGEFSNGQLYATYTTEDFEVKYPNWPNVDRTRLPESERMKVVVSNDGCTFMITSATLPSGVTFQEYTESRIREQTGTANIRLTVKDIGEKSAHLEAEATVGTASVKSVTYAFSTSAGQYYGIAFAASSELFDRVCRPLVPDVLESVRVHP